MEREKAEVEVEGGTEALHINRVYLSRGPRGEDREPLRVSVEITHPALALAGHRTWMGKVTQLLQKQDPNIRPLTRAITLFSLYKIPHL